MSFSTLLCAQKLSIEHQTASIVDQSDSCQRRSTFIHPCASVIRFGPRGTGKKRGLDKNPASDTICLTFSLSRFRLAEGNSLSVSGRGTAREKHFLKSPRFWFNVNWPSKWAHLDPNGHLLSQKHRLLQTTGKYWFILKIFKFLFHVNVRLIKENKNVPSVLFFKSKLRVAFQVSYLTKSWPLGLCSLMNSLAALS